MNNVFDLVSDFYGQDEEWDSVLGQRHVENFLRSEAWQGADNDKLVKYWDHITMLCLYLGNTDNYLGDLTEDDFIDCIAWCGRNISEFVIEDEYVNDFMDVMIKLYVYLYSKRIITNDKAPIMAKQKVFADGKIIMMDENGIFYPKYDIYNKRAAEDLPAKIFLNIGSRLQGLMELLRTFFNDPRYHKDIERAAYLYSGIFLSAATEEKPGSEEYAQCFWDYFLFDYRMIENDKNPLRHFYDEVSAARFINKNQISKDILEELLKTELVLFSIESISDEGIYRCRNFLTGEIYNLLMPIEADVDKDNYLFLGHIFYNKSMVLNFVRGMMIPKSAQKKLNQVMHKARDWFAVRCGGKLTWEDFIKRNTMFVRHCSLIYAGYVRLDSFNFECNIKDYKPAEIDYTDKVVLLLERFMSVYSFTKYDIFLAQTMWADFKKCYDPSIKISEVWAAGIILNFINANAVYNYNSNKVSEMCQNIPVAVIEKTAAVIQKYLQIEKHDARYINEEGLLLMLLS